MSKSLPLQPNLEHLKKQAKALLKAHQQSQPEVISRIKEHHPRLSNSSGSDILREEFSLQDAQLVIAREYGFESWPKLAEVVVMYKDLPFPTREFFQAQTDEEEPSGKLSKDVLRALENMHDEFGKLLNATLPPFLGGKVSAVTAYLDQATYREYIQYQKSRSDSGYGCIFTPAPLEGRAAVDCSRGLIAALLDHSSEKLELNQEDWTALDAICQRLWKDLRQAWSLVLPTEIEGTRLDSNPPSLEIAAPSDLVVVIGVQVSKPEWWITFCYPNALVKQAHSQLEEQQQIWSQM
ncbi:hypothetical protein HN588_18265 [Candidatus Bathyarchaeota archaeon]|jgi:hypothetical protein|nr:hypothetical protein [Candidatus Bathyarchaeota archaeon]